MNRRMPLPLALGIQVAVALTFAVGLRAGWFPLGVAGEWEWPRVLVAARPMTLALAGLAVVGFAGFASLGLAGLARRAGARREAGWLAGLAVAAVVAQGTVQEGAPEGYGLSKWILALSSPGSSGYYTVARGQMADPRRFLRDYPGWIARQDALHVGTHPPGLFLVARGSLAAMDGSPALARAVLDFAPPSVAAAARVMREAGALPRADAASLALTGAVTLGVCAATVVPLYLLARASLPAPLAWFAASCWPLVPSSLLFQPAADAAFPFLSTLALAGASWAARRSSEPVGLALAFGSGLLLAAGMVFTLAFLPVGLVVALILIRPAGSGLRRGAALIGATGLGFVGLTLLGWGWAGADPLATWWANQRNHARFYVEYPRSYLAWNLANPVELAVGLGLPAVAWGCLGVTGIRRWPRVSVATLAVLASLSLSGKNLSEVARLWLPLMPPLLLISARGFEAAGGGPRSLAATIVLGGALVLVLQSTIQVVYPF